MIELGCRREIKGEDEVVAIETRGGAAAFVIGISGGNFVIEGACVAGVLRLDKLSNAVKDRLTTAEHLDRCALAHSSPMSFLLMHKANKSCFNVCTAALNSPSYFLHSLLQ